MVAIPERPLVSFVVPTLNRGRYVSRAVESCLRAGDNTPDADVEVVVLDSESDDGSWEELTARFGSDPRVKLVQNRRGLGPTKSWIDGARLINGQFATFVWSDDYISPQFLTALLPALRRGAALAVGHSVIRDIDDETPLLARSGERLIPRLVFLDGYFHRQIDDGIHRPVSPACSLFSRAAFDAWIDIAEEWRRANPLREYLLWRRAIGPDLLLFLVAAKMNDGDVPLSSEVTAQFSSHPGSFTVSASRWAYETGYWLARLWTLHNSEFPATKFAAYAGAVFGYGLLLAAGALVSGTPRRLPAAADMTRELAGLWDLVRRRGTAAPMLSAAIRELFRTAGVLMRRRFASPERGVFSTEAQANKPRLVWLYPKIQKPMGGTNFVFHAAAELQGTHDVLIVATRTSPALVRRCAEMDLALVDIDQPSYTDPAFWLLYPLIVSRTARRVGALLRPDDIVISSMYPMDVIAGRLGRNDVQIIYEPFVLFHDPAYQAALDPLLRLFLQGMKFLHGKEERRAVRGARRLLTLSRFEANRIAEIYGRDADVIYEGVDTTIFRPDGETLARDYEGRTVILHSTGFDRFKGTDTVIAAVPALAARIPDLLVLVTYTREDAAALARYKAALAEAGVADRVIFLASIPYAMLPKLYRTAAVYVEPGKDRSMSLSVKEAMACGTPVVRGREGHEEVTDGVEGFLVDAGDVETFVNRVERLCRDAALRARMAAAAVNRIGRQFTWSAVADKIAAHAEELRRGRSE